MTSAPMSTRHPDLGWAEELQSYLGPACFPATYDYLAATLIQRHAPSHLLWHLSSVSRTHEFRSLDELLHLLGGSSATEVPGRGQGAEA